MRLAHLPPFPLCSEMFISQIKFVLYYVNIYLIRSDFINYKANKKIRTNTKPHKMYLGPFQTFCPEFPLCQRLKTLKYSVRKKILRVYKNFNVAFREINKSRSLHIHIAIT